MDPVALKLPPSAAPTLGLEHRNTVVGIVLVSFGVGPGVGILRAWQRLLQARKSPPGQVAGVPGTQRKAKTQDALSGLRGFQPLAAKSPGSLQTKASEHFSLNIQPSKLDIPSEKP